MDQEKVVQTPQQRIKEQEVQLFEAVVEVLKKAYGRVLAKKLVQGLTVAGACRHMDITVGKRFTSSVTLRLSVASRHARWPKW